MSGKIGMVSDAAYPRCYATQSIIQKSFIEAVRKDFSRCKLHMLNIHLLLQHWSGQSSDAKRRTVWTVQNLLNQIVDRRYQAQALELLESHPIKEWV